MKYIFVPLTIFVSSISVNTSFAQALSVSQLDIPVDTAQCVDSTPFDDNFGFNGVCSCVLDPSPDSAARYQWTT